MCAKMHPGFRKDTLGGGNVQLIPPQLTTFPADFAQTSAQNISPRHQPKTPAQSITLMDADPTKHSIRKLIDVYFDTGEALRSAIEREDSDQIEILDRRISMQFNTLLDNAPQNGEDALALMGFLIDHLVQYGAETTLTDRIKAKMLTLVAAGFGHEADAALD